MKFALVSVLTAVSTISVTGFAPPVSLGSRDVRLTSKKSGHNLKKTSTTGDLDLEVFTEDMLKASTFVYTFRCIRDVVRTHGIGVGDGKKIGSDNEEDQTKKSLWSLLFPKKQVEFYRPELIITDKGAQDANDNRNFKHVVTPDAIKLFVENNRKFFREDGIDIFFEENDRTEPFEFEKALEETMEDNMKIIDYDDAFSTKNGGLVYGIVVNLTHKWVSVVFRGTVGLTDILTDRDFRLNEEFFFSGGYGPPALGGSPGTHEGFTNYLATPREYDSVDRPLIDRILASVNDVFEKNPDVKGKDFNLYFTGHSLGGALANLSAFHAANLKEKGKKSVKHLPNKIEAMTFAAPVVGNKDFNKEYQRLERKGILRHIRVSNQGDVIPTNYIPFPLSLAFKGNTKLYTQNGVNIFLKPRRELEIKYRNTKSCSEQLVLGNVNILDNHMPPEYMRRVQTDKNEENFKQTVEELYAAKAGDCTA